MIPRQASDLLPLQRRTMRDIILGVVSILVAIVLVALGGEAAIRAVHFYTEHFSGRMNPKHITLDEGLGWLAAPDYHYEGNLVDAAGETYPVRIETNSEGYRLFGNPGATDRKKVLFLGDSYTQAMQVSNDNTFYGILADELDIEVFAFGVDGFGTLQQYLLLDQIIDAIDPDAIVLQFCPNDLINNYFPLETASAYNNNGLRRPYFENGAIRYRNPASFPALREFAARYSEFLYFIITRADRLKPAPEKPSEVLIEEQDMSYPLFVESVNVTDQLLAKVRARVPRSTPVFAFSTSHGPPYYETFKRLSRKNGLHFIDGASQALQEAESRGLMTRAADKEHWNDRGHRIVADVLGNYLRQKLQVGSAQEGIPAGGSRSDR